MKDGGRDRSDRVPGGTDEGRHKILTELTLAAERSDTSRDFDLEGRQVCVGVERLIVSRLK